MPNSRIALLRMYHQQLLQPTFDTPAQVVRWMGAVQSQDYLGAKWAVGQRAATTDTTVEQALNDGSILRFHVMRPTWHFVAAEDAHWLLALTGPRVIKNLAGRYRQLELDDDTFAHSEEVFRQALNGGRQLTNAEMEAKLNEAGIRTDIPQRFPHLLVHAELSGVICSGAWEGKQSTYALLDERAPTPAPFEREAALAELTRRYFSSHGPATLKDYSWWSGLTMADIRAGIDLAHSSLESEVIEGVTYWSAGDASLIETPEVLAGPVAHLLPNYDEYVVAYTDRDAIFDPAFSDQLHLRGGVLNNVLIVNGLVSGSWSRKFKKNEVQLRVNLLWPLTTPEQQALERAVQHYGEFYGLPVDLSVENKTGL